MRGTWRTVSVAAASCADANIATTAALVRAGAAPAWLAGLGVPARLVSAGGRVYTVGDWPISDQAMQRRAQAQEGARAETQAERREAHEKERWETWAEAPENGRAEAEVQTDWRREARAA